MSRLGFFPTNLILRAILYEVKLFNPLYFCYTSSYAKRSSNHNTPLELNGCSNMLTTWSSH